MFVTYFKIFLMKIPGVEPRTLCILGTLSLSYVPSPVYNFQRTGFMEIPLITILFKKIPITKNLHHLKVKKVISNYLVGQRKKSSQIISCLEMKCQ